jgi:hypothetical protein
MKPYETMLKVDGNNKHTSLLHRGIDYSSKKFVDQTPD